MRYERGFSLLEVLTALMLLGMLLLAVFGGIRAATHSVHSGSRSIEQLDQVRAAHQFLRHDLMQARSIPWRVDAKGDPVVFDGEPRRMRFVSPLPGYLDASGPQLQTLALVEERDGSLRLELSSDALAPRGPVALAHVAPEVLMRGIRGGHFAYYASAPASAPAKAQGEWRTQWQVPVAMPDMVRIEITPGPADGSWPRLDVLIRQSANAVNARALARSLSDVRQP